MWRRIWGNRQEFYPYLAIYSYWGLTSFVCSLKVQNRPGIVALGLLTIPSITCITVAAIKTYKELT